MSIASSHFFGRVANKFVNDSLIHSIAREIADKAVPQTMPALYLFPLTLTQGGTKMGLGHFGR